MRKKKDIVEEKPDDHLHMSSVHDHDGVTQIIDPETETERLLNLALAETTSAYRESKSFRKKLIRLKRLRDEKKRIEKEAQESFQKQKEHHTQVMASKYDFFKKKNFFDFKTMIQNWRINKFAKSAILVNMELANGDHIHFVGFIKKEKIEWNNKTYIVDHYAKYYDHAAKMYCLDYHESFTLPIIRKIPVSAMQKAVASTGITDIEMACNPATLEQFIVSEVIEKVMKGQELEDALKFVKMMVIFILIAVVIHLILFVAKSGILQQVKLW